MWTVVAAATGPMSAEEVRERLGRDLAYTTVVTTLARLHSKGMLTRHLDGRAHRYAPAASQEGLAAARMHRALAAEGDREAVLSSFVSELSAGDEALLRRLLADDPGSSGPLAGPDGSGGESGAGATGRGG